MDRQLAAAAIELTGRLGHGGELNMQGFRAAYGLALWVEGVEF